MINPRTAIIVLSYNKIDVTQKFLRDLYRNTENFVLIIIDNGSTDGAAEYLDQFSCKHDNIVYVANDHNKGIIGGRNQGYEVLCSLSEQPHYFMFLDNDQYVQKNWLVHHHEVLAYYNYDIVGVEAWTLNRDFYPFRQCKSLRQGFSYVGCGGMLMKKSVADQVGLFDTIFNPCYFEDPDFCYRCRKAGFFIGWNIKAKLIHIPHQTLGSNVNSMKHFRNSHSEFKKKWKSIVLHGLIQDNLPQFSDSYKCKNEDVK